MSRTIVKYIILVSAGRRGEHGHVDGLQQHGVAGGNVGEGRGGEQGRVDRKRTVGVISSFQTRVSDSAKE